MNRDVMGLIVKREDGSEIVNYDNPAFPSYIYNGWVEPKATWERVPHFHEDIEIVTVTSGEMAYSVNGRTLLLCEGDTIVVNSNQIHYSMCINDEVARYVIFVVHPGILASSVIVDMQAVRPITENPDLPYLRFRDMNENTDEIRDLMLSLPDIRHDAFAVTMQFFRIWNVIKRQAETYGATGGDEASSDPQMQYFKSMMYYISTSYRDSITLGSIAASAGISKSLCNVIFHRYVNESPITYLMRFRARKVAEYLRAGSFPLTEIAAMTGFNGVSYMSETFRKFFDFSPRDYRKKWQDPPAVEPSKREAGEAT